MDLTTTTQHAACLQSYWVGGGLAGVLLASLLPGQIGGLEFALCALFVTLTLDAARWQKHISSVILAGLSFALAVLAVPDQSLFAALLILLTSLVVRYAIARHRASREAGHA